MSEQSDNWMKLKDLGEKLVKLFLRMRLIGFVLGIISTIAVQSFAGFWEFREQHQKIINAQYKAFSDADKTFEGQRQAFDSVFSGKQNQTPNGLSYREVAQKYIQQLEQLTAQLPKTRDTYEEYVGSITELSKYYQEANPPKQDTVEWLVFFGEYRQDYDHFLTVRSKYLDETASQAGSYWRYISNNF